MKTKKWDLEKLGFKKVYPDSMDKEYFYWRKNIQHKYLKSLHIIVEKHISVYCKENKMFGSHEVLIHYTKTTDLNLKSILKWLVKH